jgi:hypothetical protein
MYPIKAINEAITNVFRGAHFNLTDAIVASNTSASRIANVILTGSSNGQSINLYNKQVLKQRVVTETDLLGAMSLTAPSVMIESQWFYSRKSTKVIEEMRLLFFA